MTSCEKITDKGVKNLCSWGLKYLMKLISLNLTFNGIKKINDVVLENLACQIRKSLTQMTSLKLNFNGSNEITDKFPHFSDIKISHYLNISGSTFF